MAEIYRYTVNKNQTTFYDETSEEAESYYYNERSENLGNFNYYNYDYDFDEEYQTEKNTKKFRQQQKKAKKPKTPSTQPQSQPQPQETKKLPSKEIEEANEQTINIVKVTPLSKELSPKKKLTPSDQIYNRILWDPKLDRFDFVVGYLDRFTGIQEIDLDHFVTLKNEVYENTSIPFHRVHYFKFRTQKVWDKNERINLFDDDHFLRTVLYSPDENHFADEDENDECQQ